jgi:hypothetical protein
MYLWTWQQESFDPFTQRLDRNRSDYFINSSYPELRQAYHELDELLCLPPERAHQFLWCYTTDSWKHHPDYGRVLWHLDVPDSAIIAALDAEKWEFLIGSNAYSTSDHQAGKSVRDEVLAKLRVPLTKGDGIDALVALPLNADWIRPYCLDKRYGWPKTKHWA